MRQAHLHITVILFDDRHERRVLLYREFTARAIGLLSSFERDFFIEDEDTFDGGTIAGRARNEQSGAEHRQATPNDSSCSPP